MASLSEPEMSQVAYQIGNVEKFQGDPDTLYSFINRIDYILALYATNDIRQSLIIFGHVERSISGNVMQTLGMNDMTNWTTLRQQLILNFKPQTPNHVLLEDFRNTPYKGNVREFLEEAERRRQKLISKLELEQNVEEKTLFVRLIKSSIENLIQKLPTHIYLRIINCEIPDLRSLINLLQEKGIYEVNNLTQKIIQKQSTPDKPNKLTNHIFSQPSHNIQNYSTLFQPPYNPPVAPSYVPPRFNPPNYQLPYRHPQATYYNPNSSFYPNYPPPPRQPVPYAPRPNFQRQNLFDRNRFGQQQNMIQRTPNDPNPSQAVKRLRPSDSGHSKMSIEELNNQEEIPYQQNIPYDSYHNPNYYYPEYYPESYYSQYPDCAHPQFSITEDEGEESKKIEIEQAENFQLQAPETTST